MNLGRRDHHTGKSPEKRRRGKGWNILSIGDRSDKREKRRRRKDRDQEHTIPKRGFPQLRIPGRVRGSGGDEHLLPGGS